MANRENLDSSDKRRWPATILAMSRTAKVRGRIIFLIVSMSTINDIRARGVPDGVMCAKKEPGLLLIAKQILNIHIKTVKFKLRDMWDVVDKTKGNKEKKFNKKTKQNNEMTTFFNLRVFMFFFHLFIGVKVGENWASSWFLLAFTEVPKLLFVFKIPENLKNIKPSAKRVISIKGFSAPSDVSKIENKFVSMFYHCHVFDMILEWDFVEYCDIRTESAFFIVDRCKKIGNRNVRKNQFIGNIIGKKLWLFNF